MTFQQTASISNTISYSLIVPNPKLLGVGESNKEHLHNQINRFVY